MSLPLRGGQNFVAIGMKESIRMKKMEGGKKERRKV